eukprot:SM000043S15851  [mRNA]  locus=s43:512411:517007:+ [translate_table: standard]
MFCRMYLPLLRLWPDEARPDDAAVNAGGPYDDPYISDGTSAPKEATYDYIVVGGGAAGCPLAATLSHGFKVLLLERGGVPYDQPSVLRREGFPTVLATRAVQPFRSEDGVQNRRGRVLGGGSSVNAGFYSRAAADFIEQTGWTKELVKESYEWVEKQIVFDPPMGPWQSALRNSLLEAGVQPYNGHSLEHLYGTKIGNTIFDANGTRHTAADLLRTSNYDNLRVHVFSEVEKVLFDRTGLKPRAIGVQFSDAKGEMHTVTLRPTGEVLMTAGALGTPQILKLSGIGPADELLALGIPVVCDVPTLGRNITDIPINIINIFSPNPVEESSLGVVGISREGTIFEGASGGNKTQVAPAAGELTTVPPVNRTDALTSQTSAILNLLPPFISSEINQAGYVLSKVYRPKSRGWMRLKTLNVGDNPIVRYNYYHHEDDIDTCISGTRVLHKILNATAFQPYRSDNPPLIMRLLYPPVATIPYGQFKGSIPILPDSNNHTAAAQWCKDTVSVIWHFHGGCHVGDCVDSSYKLIGVDSLRVIDGSTWLTSPGTNPMATCLMLGRYMGIQILRERGVDPIMVP